jgi:uncharacterized UBP type Zn finger protein
MQKEFVEGGICACWNPNNVTESLHGRLIYKDECCRCCATPKDETGLDVCLRTVVGSCNPEGVPDEENHSKIHYKNTGNPLVMNIKKTPKANIDEPTKVTKLAIGKPGGVDPEQDKFDTTVSVFCHKCNKYLDESH